MTSFTEIEYLPSRQHLLCRLKPGGRIAEIGVWRGDFAADILNYAYPAELHLIDPWVGTIACGDQHGQNIVWRDGQGLYEEVKDRFANDRRVTIVRKRSTEALREYPDGYFDFIYIDGDHDVDSVLADLCAAEPKCRGLLAGHDYCDGFPGVMQAVRDFLSASTYTTLTKLTRDGCPSFLLERL